MKKILSLIIALVIALSAFTVLPVFAESNVYNVATAEQLDAAIAKINAMSNSSSVVINLKADIEYNKGWTSEELLTYATTGEPPSSKTSAPATFTPLGTKINGSSVYPFMGTFNGGGYTISGLCVRRVKPSTDAAAKTAQGAALAGYAKGATIEKLTLERSAFYAAGGWAGAIVGNAHEAENKVSDINVTDVKISAKTNHAGGIIGVNYKKLNISNVNLEEVTVSGISYVGGVLGYTELDTTISNAELDKITVSGTSNVGGVLGYTKANTAISNVDLDEITVSGTSNVGGVLGYTEADATISNVNADVIVNGTTTAVGGIVGYNKTGVLGISNIFVEGTVASTNASKKTCVGGVCGQNDDSGTLNLTNAVIATDVTGYDYVGSALGGATLGGISNITNVLGSGAITATSEKAGGIVGCVNSAGATALKNCAYVGTVTSGNFENGPVFGYNHNTSVTATACYGFKKDNTSASTAKLYGGCSSGTVTVTNHSNINCKTRDELAAIIDGWGKATTDPFTNSTDALGALFNNTIVGIQTGYDKSGISLNKSRAVRFIATVNDTDYQEVGFIIKMTRSTASGTESATVTRSTKNVYTSINSVTESTLASEFDSKYLIAIGVNQLNDVSDLTFEVTSYVITLDGITYITDVETIKYKKINGTIYINGKEEK